jgi:hypothetical protein
LVAGSNKHIGQKDREPISQHRVFFRLFIASDCATAINKISENYLKHSCCTCLKRRVLGVVRREGNGLGKGAIVGVHLNFGYVEEIHCMWWCGSPSSKSVLGLRKPGAGETRTGERRYGELMLSAIPFKRGRVFDCGHD